MSRIHIRRKLTTVAVGALVLATTASVAAAADSGPQPTPSAKASSSQSAAAAKQDPKQNPKPDPKQDPKGDAAFAAVAKALGVTVDQLNDAMRATKVWAGTSGVDVTPEVFADHVASILHVPAAKALAAFKANGFFSDPGPGKPGGQKPKPGGGQAADMAKAAKDLGVTRTQLEDALMQTKMWIGSTGATPTPEVFAGHVASILGKSADQVLKVLEADGIIDTAPAKPLG